MVLQLHEYLMRHLSDIHTSPHQRKRPRIGTIAIRVLFSKCVCEVANEYIKHGFTWVGRYVCAPKRGVYTPLSILHSKATCDTCLVKICNFSFLHWERSDNDVSESTSYRVCKLIYVTCERCWLHNLKGGDRIKRTKTVFELETPW